MNIREVSASEPLEARKIIYEDGAVIIRNFSPADLSEKIRAQYDAISTTVPKVPEESPIEWSERVLKKLFVEVPELQIIPHHVQIKEFFEKFFDSKTFVHPHIITRLVPPVGQAKRNYEMLPHQDFPFNQGTVDTITIWMPFFDCDMKGSALAVSLGSHQGDIYPYDQLNDQSRFPLQSTSFKAGDVMMFHSKTVHCTFPNQSDKVRFSIDFRVQSFKDNVCNQILSMKYADSQFDNVWDLSEVHSKIADPAIKFYWLKECPKEISFDPQYEDELNMKLIAKFAETGGIPRVQIEQIAQNSQNMRVVLRAKKALASRPKE